MVVAEEAHGCALPLRSALLAPEELGDHGIVAVGEDVGLHDDVVPHGALDRIAAAIDLGTDAFDDDARGWCFLFTQA
jgi:hypothetical protein